MEAKIVALAELFRETGKAHHQAYIETDGAHADWAIWYADYLHEKLPTILGATLNKSDIIYLLMHFSYEHKVHAPNLEWAQYYARALVLRYA
jgi:NAD(P)H-hydrate epimerase